MRIDSSSMTLDILALTLCLILLVMSLVIRSYGWGILFGLGVGLIVGKIGTEEDLLKNGLEVFGKKVLRPFPKEGYLQRKPQSRRRVSPSLAMKPSRKFSIRCTRCERHSSTTRMRYKIPLIPFVCKKCREELGWKKR